MQSMPILTSNPSPNTPPMNGPMNESSGSGEFSKMLARDLASRKQQHDNDTKNSSSVTKAPDAAAKSPSPSAKGADAEVKNSSSITKVTDTDEKAVDATTTQIPVDHGPPPQSLTQDISRLLLTVQTPLTQDPAANTLLAQSSSTQTGEMTVQPPLTQDPAANALLAQSSGTQTGEMTAGLMQKMGQEISGKVTNESITPIQTGNVSRHNPLQSLQDSARSAIGAGRSDLETGKTANIAADEKILPQSTSNDKNTRSFSQMLNQESSISSSPNTSGTSSSVSVLSAINSATPNAPPTEQNLRLEPRVGTPAWDGALAQKVTWMSNQQMQVAQLQLNPPDLGPMEVTLTLGTGPDAETRIEFTSPHLAVREALQSALPQLREMMENSGISLGSATVSAESFQQQSQSGRQDNPSGRSSDNLSQNSSEMATRSITTRSHDGMVDIFA